MGASREDFMKFPRTPHLFGSIGTSDDKHMIRKKSLGFIADSSLIVEEKLDGTNVGIHFNSAGRIVLQCRGHEITSGMHPQCDLFKQWTISRRAVFERILEVRLILFGEWLYACHTLRYHGLSHYFYEFDIYDKTRHVFLDYQTRMELIQPNGIETVPVLHTGPISEEEIPKLIGPSRFQSQFQNPLTGVTDDLMEGIYLRTEADGIVSFRAKYVRPAFVEKINQSEHWQHRAILPNLLADGVDIWR